MSAPACSGISTKATAAGAESAGKMAREEVSKVIRARAERASQDVTRAGSHFRDLYSF